MFTSLDLTPHANPSNGHQQRKIDEAKTMPWVFRPIQFRIQISSLVVLSAGWGEFLLAVRNPNVFHLHSVIEKPAAFALLHVEPVNGAAFVGEDLL
jgi:hypothetical protein